MYAYKMHMANSIAALLYSCCGMPHSGVLCSLFTIRHPTKASVLYACQSRYIGAYIAYQGSFSAGNFESSLHVLSCTKINLYCTHAYVVPERVRNIVMSRPMSVCLSAHITRKHTAKLQQIFVPVAYGPGSEYL